MAVRVVTVVAALGALAATVTGCSSTTPSLAGVWTPSDGSGVKVVNADGSCSGMFYNGTTPLDIGGPETCALSSSAVDGAYTLVVQQPPNSVTYRATFDGDTLDLSSTSGTHIVTLTRR